MFVKFLSAEYLKLNPIVIAIDYLIQLIHTGKAAIKNVNIIDKRRSKIVRNRVLIARRQMATKNAVYSDF